MENWLSAVSSQQLVGTFSFQFLTRCVRDWSGILCERISGTRFGDGDEVTELVEVPRSYFGERDGNMASKDIAESPTAIAGTPRLAFSYQRPAISS